MSSFTEADHEVVFPNGLIWSKSIVFSSNPTHYEFQLPQLDDEFGMFGRIINYSELYREFVLENESSRVDYTNSLIDPMKINTGDILQTSDYRGVGSYYAVWLHADIFHNPSSVSLARVSKAPKASGDNRLRTRRAERFNFDQFHLDPPTWRKIQSLLESDEWPEMSPELHDLLKEESPELLALLKDGNRGSNAIFDIKRARFEGDPGGFGGDPVDWENLSAEEVFNDGQTDNIGDYFCALPHMKYPSIRSSGFLSRTIQSRPWMQLYLFSHLDEMGYAAPPAVSMAPIGYFPIEYSDRHIDLSLLPSPLDEQTTCGYVLNRIRSKFPAEALEDTGEDIEEDEGRGEEEEEEDGNDEDENGENEDEEEAEKGKKTKKEQVSSTVRDLAFLEFEGEGAIFWFSLAGSQRHVNWDPDQENPLVTTRKIFHRHAEEIRKKLVNLLPEESTLASLGDEDLSGVFHQLLWS
jgi:hypothetical protein